MSDSVYAIKIIGTGASGDPYRVASAFEIDDDEIEAEDDFSKPEYVVSFEGLLNSPEFRIIVEEAYSNGVEVKVYRPVLSDAGPASVFVAGSQLPLFYRAEERFVSSGVVPLDDRYKGSRELEDNFRGSDRGDIFTAAALKGRGLAHTGKLLQAAWEMMII
ncbi:MAG: hypothetical protein R6W06_02325 [Prochlorococcaceae cyanobacterium]